MNHRRRNHSALVGLLVTVSGAILLGCASGPQIVAEDASYAVPTTGSATRLPRVPWDGDWTTGHVFPQEVIVEASGSRIAVVYEVPGELPRDGLSRYAHNPFGFALARHPFAGIMMEIFDYETGEQLAREMLVQAEIQTIVSVPDDTATYPAQPASWAVFHSAELPIGPTEERVNWSDHGAIFIPHDDLADYTRDKIADYDRDSLARAQLERLRAGANLSPDGTRFAQVNRFEIEVGSMDSPDEVQRTIPAPEQVYAPGNPPSEPFEIRVLGWSDDSTVLLERGSARELWVVDVSGEREPVLVNVQQSHPNRRFTFFESTGTLTMHVDGGGSDYDSLVVWRVNGYDVERLGSGATPRDYFIPVFVPRNRRDRLILLFEGTAQVYNPDGFRLLAEVSGSVPDGANARSSRVALDDDGNLLVLAWTNGTIDVWDLERQRPVGTWDLQPGDTEQLEYERIWTQH